MSYSQQTREIEHPQAYENAIKRNILNNARKTFYANNPDAEAVLANLSDSASWSSFAADLLKSFDSYGKLSFAQMAAGRSMLAKSNARKAERMQQKVAANAVAAANSSHVGTVGKREDFTLTIKVIITMEGMYGTSYMHICEDAKGNAFVYKGTTEIGEKGETVTLKATVKEHSVYQGVAQTIINRPKVSAKAEQE